MTGKPVWKNVIQVRSVALAGDGPVPGRTSLRTCYRLLTEMNGPD